MRIKFKYSICPFLMNIKQIQELFVENINQNSKICTAFMQFVKLFSCNRLMFSVVLVISELL
jgi:hypothetical protein